MMKVFLTSNVDSLAAFYRLTPNANTSRMERSPGDARYFLS